MVVGSCAQIWGFFRMTALPGTQDWGTQEMLQCGDIMPVAKGARSMNIK